MVGITQNKQVLYFHCGPLKNVSPQEKQKWLSKNFKDIKTACK